MSSIEFNENNIYLNILNYLHKREAKIEFKSADTLKEISKNMQFQSHVYIKTRYPSGEIMYVFLLSKKNTVSKSGDFKKILSVVKEKNVKVMVVSPNGLKPMIKKFLKSYKGKQFNVLDIMYKYFVVDPTRNVFVKRHEICSEAEKKRALYDNRVKGKNMPRILKTDPQVMMLDGEVGQLVKIYRTDPVCPSVYYRMIV